MANVSKRVSFKKPKFNLRNVVKNLSSGFRSFARKSRPVIRKAIKATAVKEVIPQIKTAIQRIGKSPRIGFSAPVSFAVKQPRLQVRQQPVRRLPIARTQVFQAKQPRLRVQPIEQKEGFTAQLLKAPQAFRQGLKTGTLQTKAALAASAKNILESFESQFEKHPALSRVVAAIAPPIGLIKGAEELSQRRTGRNLSQEFDDAMQRNQQLLFNELKKSQTQDARPLGEKLKDPVFYAKLVGNMLPNLAGAVGIGAAAPPTNIFPPDATVAAAPIPTAPAKLGSIFPTSFA